MGALGLSHMIWYKWDLVSSMGSVLDFNKAPLDSEQPKRSHCNDNQHLYMAGAVSRCKAFSCIFSFDSQNSPGGGNTIYTDDEGAEAQRGEMTSPRSPSYRKAESGLSLRLQLSNFILHTMSTPPLDGVPLLLDGVPLLHGGLILKEFAELNSS